MTSAGIISPREIPVERLLPHRPPFLFVSRLVLCEPGHAVAEARIDPSWLWGTEAGTVPRAIMIEILAQTVGAATAYEAMIENRERERGLLVAARRFSFSKDVAASELLESETWEGRMMKPFGSARGVVRCGGETVALGELQFISLNPDGGITERRG